MTEIISKKVTAGEIFDCKDINNFIATIIQVMPYTGFSGSKFYLCDVESIHFLTKLCLYRKSAPEIYGRKTSKVMSQTDTEIAILEILRKKIILAGISPCVVEILYHTVCKGISKQIPTSKICERLTAGVLRTPADDVNAVLCAYDSYISAGLAYDKCAFVVLEQCDITLDKFLRGLDGSPISDAIFRYVMFHLIYTMYSIRKIYPKFRHQDLHTENIMLKFDTDYRYHPNDVRYLVFHVGESNKMAFTLPYFGIIPKIIDFGFSVIPEEGIMSDVTIDRLTMHNRSDNDILIIMYWINYTLERFAVDKTHNLGKMLTHIDPSRSYATVQRPTDKTHVPEYIDMLKCKAFVDYQKHTVEPKYIHHEYYSN